MTIFLKTLVFTLIFPGTAVVYLPWLILRAFPGSITSGPCWLRYLAIGPWAAGLAIYLWCAWDFGAKGRGTPAPIDPPKSLVASGLYRHVRNPMYVGILTILFGEIVWFGSSALLIYWAVLFTLFNAFILLYEEPTLRKLFGESYRNYCAHVPRWIPRGRGWPG